MQKIHNVGDFPEQGESIALPEDCVNVIAVLYRDRGRTTHDVNGLVVSGGEVLADWPEDVHDDACVRVVYEAADE